MRSLIPHDWSVPNRFRARLGERVGRQRHMFEDGHLLLVLHEPPKEGEDERRPRLFWRAPDGTWKSNGLGSGVQALRTHLKQFEDALEALEQTAQSARLADEWFALLRKLAPLHRTARNLHSALQGAREAVDDRELITARDHAGDIERGFELLYTQAKNGLDYTVARRAEEHAEAQSHAALESHRLNLIAAIFLPIAAVTSVFGMNLPHGLESIRHPGLFWVVAASSFLLGFWLKSVLAPRPKR